MKAQRLHLKHSLVHHQAISKFVNQHCQEMEWYNLAHGALRARNLESLLKLASSLNKSLVSESPWVIEALPSHSSIARARSKFRITGQFVAMVAKYPYDEQQRPDSNPDEVAIRGLAKDERRNRRLNQIFDGHMARGPQSLRHPSHAVMRTVINKVLGESPPIEKMLGQCDFSAGAAVGVAGQSTHIGVKAGGEVTVTASCFGYFLAAARANHQLWQLLLTKCQHGWSTLAMDASPMEIAAFLGVRIVNNNEICCVPKNSDTSRTIAKEPSGNSFVQKGVDNFLRSLLLRKLNLDLTNQEVNQIMAREGSYMDMTDPYVTIDVKSASNSVIRALVRYLLPKEWFSFLNAIRSPEGKWPDGEIRRYELFSSMGNGFTFPLETLIFAAVVIAAARITGNPVDFRVYGDDIIVRQSQALVVIEVLQSCGFRVNVDKTHVFGPFRESCGANWYEGQDVTPVYWRTRITTRSALQAIHNAHHLHPEVQATLRSFDKEMPCVCPSDNAQYDWVTDQAFRVTQDVWMQHRDVVWRRDTLSFRYPLLISSPVKDETFHAQYKGSVYKQVRWLALIRGANYGQEFLKRRSTFVSLRRPAKDTLLECDVSKALCFPKVHPSWSVPDIHAFNLLLKGGMQQRRAREIAHVWATGG